MSVAINTGGAGNKVQSLHSGVNDIASLRYEKQGVRAQLASGVVSSLGCCWRTLWVGLPACGAALGGLLSVADLWGPGRPSHLGVSFLASACVQ